LARLVAPASLIEAIPGKNADIPEQPLLDTRPGCRFRDWVRLIP